MGADAGERQAGRAAVPRAHRRGRVGAEAVAAGLGEGDGGEVRRLWVGGQQPGAGMVGVVVDLAQFPALLRRDLAVLAGGAAGRVVRAVYVADVEATGATFEQEELVRLVGHGLEVPAAGGEGSEVVMAGGERLAAAQPQQLVLQGSEFGRGALAAAFVHDRGPPQAARLPAAVRPVGVVEVGQAQDVAEFVAEDARAALGTDREAVDPLAADGQRFAAVGGKPALLGPDGILAPAVILADAGAEQEDVVDGAVGVVVIEGVVDLALPLRAGFADGFREVDILAVGVVGAVVGRLAGERRDGRQGEFEGGQAVELAVEILLGLPHRSFQLRPRGRERPVLELNGQDDHPEDGQQQGQRKHNKDKGTQNLSNSQVAVSYCRPRGPGARLPSSLAAGRQPEAAPRLLLRLSFRPRALRPAVRKGAGKYLSEGYL